MNDLDEGARPLGYCPVLEAQRIKAHDRALEWLRENKPDKGPNDVQATLVAPSAEERLERLTKALLEACEVGEQPHFALFGPPALSNELVRKIISENT